MANRAQRRKAKKQQHTSLPKSQEKLLAGLYKNGITEENLKEEWHKGHDAGRDAAIRTCYAAVCLAAKEAFGFGSRRAYKLLCTMDKHVCETLSSLEAIDKVFDEMGITIRFHNDPFDRIEQKE